MNTEQEIKPRKSNNGRSGKKSPRNIIQLLAIAILLVSLVICLIYLVKDRKPEGPTATVTPTSVCDDEQITKAVDFAGATSGARDFVESIDQIAESVKQKSEYKSDPNCLGILTLYYLSYNDRDGLADIISEFKKLGNDGLYVRNDLSQYASLPLAEQTLAALKGLSDGENPAND